MTGEHPVAVIGAGIAGLTAVAVLSSRGRRTIVYEASGRVGGCCATLDGPAGRSEPAASVLVGAEMLAAQLCDVVDVRRHLVRAEPAVRVIGDDFELDLGSLHALVAHLERQSPADVPRLLALADRCGRLHRELPAALWDWAAAPRRPRRRLVRLARWGLAPYGRLVDRTFTDPSLRTVFRGFSLFYAGLPASRAPAALAALPIVALTEGCYELRGGIQQLAEMIAARVRATGGEIRVSEPVERLVASNGRIESVRTSYGVTRVSGAVAACDLRTTLQLLGRAPWSMRGRVRIQRSSVRCCSILGRAPDACARPAVTWVLPRRTVTAIDVGGAQLWPLVTVTRGPGEGGARRLRIGGALDSAGAALDRDAAGRVASLLLTMARRADVTALDDVEIWTPSTYARRLGLPGGAAFGPQPSRTQMGPGRYGPRTPLANLVVAGQSTYPGFGIPYVALSGRLAATVLAP